MKHMKILVLMILFISFFCSYNFGDWTGATRLTWDSGKSMAPSIATNSSNYILLVWDNDRSGEPQIYFKKSTDNRTNRSTTPRITWNTFKKKEG